MRSLLSRTAVVTLILAGLAAETQQAKAAEATYGCEANPTGNPIGGGEGYSDIYETGDFVVRNREELIAALRKAQPGQVVFVPGGAEIDLSGQRPISIPAGVTLAGTRGKDGCPGARLFTATFGRMLTAAGDDIRLTGLRFEGAEMGTERIAGSGSFLSVNHYNTRVDNCEIYGFNISGIGVGSGALKTHIHHNYIHHCQRGGYGYGVSVGSGSDVRIIANKFDYCRHHVACSGSPGAGYEVAWNLIMENATSSHFDMHGGRDRGDATDIAGDWMHVHHNTFLSPHIHVGIRGTPSDGAAVHNNWFARPAEVSVRATGNTRVFDNVFGPDKTPQERAFNFVEGKPVDCEGGPCPFCHDPGDGRVGPASRFMPAGWQRDPRTVSRAGMHQGIPRLAPAHHGMLFPTYPATVLLGASALHLAAPDVATGDRLGDPLPAGAVARLGTLRMRYGGISDMIYLPDGRAIIAVGSVVEIWNMAAGECLFRERIVPAGIRSIDVRQDGQAVLLADSAGTVHEWDPAKNEVLRTVATGQSSLLSARYSPDGARVLTTGVTPPTLKEFELATGRELAFVKDEMHTFSHGIYDVSGKTAFVSGAAGSGPVLAHYDLAAGKLLNTWHKDYNAYNRALELSPDGERLLAGTRHMAVEFQVDGYKELNRFRGHHGHAVPAVAYCRDPDQILTGSRDGSIRRWDRVKNEVLLRWVAHSAHCTLLRVSPDGSRVLSFGGGMVVESDIATGKPTLDWDRHGQAVQAVAVMPGGRRVVSGSSDATLRVWDIDTGESLSVIEGANLGAYAVAIAPEGDRVAAGCKDGLLREFRLPGGGLLRELSGHLGYVRSVAYTPDGGRLISSGGDGRIRIWAPGNGEPEKVMKEHRGGVLCVAVSDDGKRLISGGRDGTARLWDLAEARLLQTFEGHRGWVDAVCFARDGRHAFSSGRDGRILKWDLQTGEIAGEMSHGGWVRALALSPDGAILCAGGEDNAITCWNPGSGEQLARWRGHASHVLGLAIAPDSRRLVSASADTSLLVWPLPAGGPQP
ncbi:MAG: hypothetical protein RBS80_23610 [Thermoguttaceae bacterium]|nr:hypothetical protein [Thermoguttaceae bacterium]